MNQFHHHHHPNGIMTAPRPTRFANRFGSEYTENIKSVNPNHGGHVNHNVVVNSSVPRKNLFSPNIGSNKMVAPPPLLPQSQNGKMMKNQHQLASVFYNEENRLNHSSSSCTPMKSQQHSHHHHGGHAAAVAPFTPERSTPARIANNKTCTPGALRDSTTASASHQQQQPCGLSAMISLETSYRTPIKSTTKKQGKKHRRNPSSVSRLFPTPSKEGNNTPNMMRSMTPATTTKKHKRSTSGSMSFLLSTPTRPSTNAATTTNTPMRTTANTPNPDLDKAIKRDLNWALPSTDTKLMSMITTASNKKPSHRRTPSRFKMTPQKQVFEMVEDDKSSSSSGSGSSDEIHAGAGGDFKMNLLASMETEEEDDSIVIPPPPAPSAPPPTATPSAPTPNKKLRRTIPLPSPSLSKPKRSARKQKLQKQLTPPRHYYASHAVDTSSSGPDEMGLLTTGFEGLEMYRMTSTELDPSDFQIELPTKKEVQVHAKICNLMNGYTSVQRDFNFAMLSGITRSTLEKEYEASGSREKKDDDPMIAGICHRNVVKEVLECADDLVVEGFFREYGGKVNNKDENSGGGNGSNGGGGDGGGERMEACVFSSESLRQIIVCFRGSTAAQARPVKSNLFGREASSILDEEKQKVPILTSFQSAYFSTSLEKALSFLLANLATRKPFFDVVMTGHSFGGAMATIASLRYAMDNSQMRVLCHTFGCPRIGGEEWRQLVHSVPNLRLYRVEKAHDPFVTLPTGNEWVHCGHSIQFGDAAQGGENVQFTAHRFDRSTPPNVSLSHTLQKVATEPVRVLKTVQSVATEPGKVLRSVQSKVVNNMPIQGSSLNNGKDASIRSYVDKLSSSGDNNWVTEFSGMKGKGVSGLDNEMRTLA